MHGLGPYQTCVSKIWERRILYVEPDKVLL